MDKYKPTESEIVAFADRHGLDPSQCGTIIDDARSMHLLRSNPVPEQPAPAPTKVIFRRHLEEPREVVAIFPELPADVVGRYATCYAHVGQHGSCDPVYLVDVLTLPATPEEYAPLQKELEQIGYVLDVIIKDQVAAVGKKAAAARRKAAIACIS